MAKLVYLPMSADVFHIGHLRAIRQCARYGKVIVGLLTDEVIRNYKGEPIIPFNQRKELLEAIPEVYKVVRQTSLNPINFISGVDYVASGDGWETEELEAIKKVGAQPLNISYCKEQSTSAIKTKIQGMFLEAFSKQFKDTCYGNIRD